MSDMSALEMCVYILGKVQFEFYAPERTKELGILEKVYLCTSE